MKFSLTKKIVGNRGAPPESFLVELVQWAKGAPDLIFAPNRVPNDAFTAIKSSLARFIGRDGSGTETFVWDSPADRKAAMLELMRVHAGRESSWQWQAGVDTTNKTSMSNEQGEETGIFQVSFDSTYLDSAEGQNIMAKWAKEKGIDTVETFIPAMKKNRPLALEYYARLVRVSIAWAGPLLRHNSDSVYPYLSRAAASEFKSLLAE